MNTNYMDVPQTAKERFEDVNLILLAMKVFQYWKQIFLATAVGFTLFYVALSFVEPTFKSNSVVKEPFEGDVFSFRDTFLVEGISRSALFEKVVQQMSSQDVLFEFLLANDWLDVFFGNDSRPNSVKLNILSQNLEFILSRDDVESSEVFAEVIIYSENELAGTEFINEYLGFVANRVIDRYRTDSIKIRELKLSQLDLLIQSKRDTAKGRRLSEIAVLENSINLQLEELEQRKQGIISKAEQDRAINIEKIVYENKLKLEQLKQEYSLLVEKAKNDRVTAINVLQDEADLSIAKNVQLTKLLVEKTEESVASDIAKAKEALVIAESLKLELPTSISDFRESGDGTNINLNGSNDVPLYLMGTKYLKSLIEVLSGRSDHQVFTDEIVQLKLERRILENNLELSFLSDREDDEKFIEQLNQLKVEIAKVENDKVLEHLRNTVIDSNRIAELSQIEIDINRLKNDKRLEALRNRDSDDPYISGLVELLDEKRILESRNFLLNDSLPFVVSKSAIITGRPIKPRKLLISVFGAFFFGVFAVLFILARFLISHRLEASSV